MLVALTKENGAKRYVNPRHVASVDPAPQSALEEGLIGSTITLGTGERFPVQESASDVVRVLGGVR